ncbi:MULTISPECIES: transposase [Sorangium]|uniref:transposase n=1 Tax=Sorangium TaxID=39643 RepID=UPI003D9C4724
MHFHTGRRRRRGLLNPCGCTGSHAKQGRARGTKFLRSEAGRGRAAFDDRRFAEAVLWMLRTGTPWRDLPGEYGPWKAAFNRFDRWSESGKWQRLLKELQVDVDPERFSLDARIVRAHQYASGLKGAGGARHSSIARRLLTQDPSDRRRPGLAPRVRDHRGATPRHPARPRARRALRAEMPHRRQGLGLERHPSAARPDGFGRRHLFQRQPHPRAPVRPAPVQGALAVECTFNLLKGFRRFATRDEKTLRNYAAFVALTCAHCAHCWLRI